MKMTVTGVWTPSIERKSIMIIDALVMLGPQNNKNKLIIIINILIIK